MSDPARTGFVPYGLVAPARLLIPKVRLSRLFPEVGGDGEVVTLLNGEVPDDAPGASFPEPLDNPKF